MPSKEIRQNETAEEIRAGAGLEALFLARVGRAAQAETAT